MVEVGGLGRGAGDLPARDRRVQRTMSGGVSVSSTAPSQSSAVRWSMVIWFSTTTMFGAGW
jgi:hypothetical protein